MRGREEGAYEDGGDLVENVDGLLGGGVFVCVGRHGCDGDGDEVVVRLR